MEEKRTYYIRLPFLDKLNILLYQYLSNLFLHEELVFLFLTLLIGCTYVYIWNYINLIEMIIGILLIISLYGLKGFVGYRKLEKSLKIKINRKRNKLLLYNELIPIDQIKVLILGSDSAVYFRYYNRDYFNKSFFKYFHYKFEKGNRFVSFNKKIYIQVYSILKELNLPILLYLINDDIYCGTKIEPNSISKEEIPIVLDYIDQHKAYLLKSYQRGKIYLYQKSDIIIPYIVRSAIIFLFMLYFYKIEVFYLLMVLFGIIAYPIPYLFVDLMSYRSNEYGVKFIFLNMELLKDFLQKTSEVTFNLFDYEPIFDFDIDQVELLGLEG